MRLPDGTEHWPAALDVEAQRQLVSEIFRLAEGAPFYRPTMPRSGKPLSVQMTNFGKLGWVSDKTGYRYQPVHPVTGAGWPPIPDELLKLWIRYARFSGAPEACLVNLYRDGARLGSHVDADEQEMAAPVLSVSLGDDAVFHVGGVRRADPKVRFMLTSGDIVMFGGPSRRAYHGIDKVLAGSSALVPGGGRINLTMRRVTPWRGGDQPAEDAPSADD